MVAFPPGDEEYRIQTNLQFQKIYPELVRLYPDAHCALLFKSPYELLVATILSAQCTDERVNMITPVLFARAATPEAMIELSMDELEAIIRSAGFFRNKARNIMGMSKILVEQYNGIVPDSMEELVKLPGVARKTANVVLGNAYGKNEGIPVDTHVTRLSQRLGLSRFEEPEKIEKDLMREAPREEWYMVAHRIIWHGRKICQARKPLCDVCPLKNDCPSFDIFHSQEREGSNKTGKLNNSPA